MLQTKQLKITVPRKLYEEIIEYKQIDSIDMIISELLDNYIDTMRKQICIKCGASTPSKYVKYCEKCFFIEFDKLVLPNGVTKGINPDTGEEYYSGIQLKSKIEA